MTNAGYTKAQLLALWTQSVDPGYSQQMLAQGEGDGSLEHVTQGHAQLERVSAAIDRSTQGLYILPWSGQTDAPAGGARKATVQLSANRTKFFPTPLVFLPGTFVAEVQADASDTGPAEVETGRNYLLSGPLVFMPGETGPVEVSAEAENVGYGYNNPLPGTIRAIRQRGVGFSNDAASIRLQDSNWRLECKNDPDVITPDMVGQYIAITTGPNAGALYRIRGYIPPQTETAPETGGSALLDVMLVMDVMAIGGTNPPIPGETVNQSNTNASGVLYKAVRNPDTGFWRFLISLRSGVFDDISDLTALSSGTTYGVGPLNDPELSTIYDNTPIQDIGFTAWLAVDVVKDLGLTVTNPESPQMGRSPLLDELGAERDVYRTPGEVDDVYRQRVAKLADVVSPNAMRRIANRLLSPFDFEGTLREAGQFTLPGMYYDAPITKGAYSYDNDCAVLSGILTGVFIEGEPVMVNTTPDLLPVGTAGVARGAFAGITAGKFFFAKKGLNSWKWVAGAYAVGLLSGAVLQIVDVLHTDPRKEDTYKYYFDSIEFRAFFSMGVPLMAQGDFGFFFDAGPACAYDAAPFLNFYDGFPVNTAILQLTLYEALNKAKAGGVSFDLHIETQSL